MRKRKAVKGRDAIYDVKCRKDGVLNRSPIQPRLRPACLREGAALHEKASGSVHRVGVVSARVRVTEPPAKRRADYYWTARKGGRRAEKQCVRTADSEFDCR